MRDQGIEGPRDEGPGDQGIRGSGDQGTRGSGDQGSKGPRGQGTEGWNPPSSFSAPIPNPLSPRKRFDRDVSWNIVALAVLGASGITLNLIIGWYRGPAALGVFNQVYAIYIVLSQLAVGGVHASVLKHVSHNQDNKEKCSHIAATALLLASAISAVVCLVAYWQRGAAASFLQSPGVATGLGWAIPGLFFFSLNKILLNVLNGMRNMRAFAALSALRFVLIVLTVVVLVTRGASAETLPLGFAIAEGLLFVALMAYVNLRLFVLRVPAAWREFLGEHLSFGTRGMLCGLISDLNTRVDVLMLGYFTTDEQVGIYTMAATLAEGLYMLPVAVQRNVNPIIGRYFAEGDTDRIQQVARKVRRIMHPAMALVALAAVAAYPLLLGLLFPDQDFAASWPVFAILLAGVVVHSGYAPMGGILFQGGRPGLHTLLMVCVVAANAGLNALLIPYLGIIGAAAATACAYALQAAGLVAFARRAFAVRL